jgi:hypothetical protein
MAEVTRRDPDQVARDAAELVQAIAGEQLVTALLEAGAVTRPRAEVVAAGWWIQHGRAVRFRPRKKGVQ